MKHARASVSLNGMRGDTARCDNRIEAVFRHSKQLQMLENIRRRPWRIGNENDCAASLAEGPARRNRGLKSGSAIVENAPHVANPEAPPGARNGDALDNRNRSEARFHHSLTR